MFKLNDFKTSQAKALAITTFVRDHHALLSQFQTMLKETCNDHRRTLSVSAAMQWYSLHACLSRVPKNKELLEKQFLERGYTELLARSASTRTAVVKLQKVQIDLRDRSFWWELRQVVVFLDPVIEALRELESDTCPTSHITFESQRLRYGRTANRTPSFTAGSCYTLMELRAHRFYRDSILLRPTHQSQSFLISMKRIGLTKAINLQRGVKYFGGLVLREQTSITRCINSQETSTDGLLIRKRNTRELNLLTGGTRIKRVTDCV
ncbi:hypothetical protein PHMEG_00033404 [Phytophthora megakarya]|uniref:Uncharacterized protein n=1 Tax=Phytophthora megakarya TaxID=4795 RepID=A0A225UU70_9STRA|nr:hypothetical protein PHMEG_00033404 [Phytophthora megakarya]